MNKKLKNIIDTDVFKRIVLEGKEGIFTDELYKLGDTIWKEAQKDAIEKIKEFEKQEKIIIITEEDKELLHGFDFTQENHIKIKQKLKEYLNQLN